MIRKLTEADRHTTLNFLLEEPEINLFAIGDIERFGFDAPFQTLWGDFEPGSAKLQAVLLRYESNYIPYFKSPDYDPAIFASLMLSDPDFRMLSGRLPLVRKVQEALTEAAKALALTNIASDQTAPNYIEKSTYFCKLTQPGSLSPEPQTEPQSQNQTQNQSEPQSHSQPQNQIIKIATPDDAPRILELIKNIDEFSDTLTTTEERLRDNIESGASRVYFTEDPAGRLLTVAQTAAENSASAMIVGVATHKDMRNRGLMSANLSALCRDLLSEGKTLCLFYDNPSAGSVYHRLGFETIDQWLMLIMR